jgi:hypothetical protein
MRVLLPILAASFVIMTVKGAHADENLKRPLRGYQEVVDPTAPRGPLLRDVANEKVYRIQCVVYQRDKDGKENVISRPIVATVAKQPARVQIAQGTPLVTSVEKTAEGRAKPNVTLIVAGTNLNISITPDHDGRVAYDLSIERSAIESVENTKDADGSVRQAARIGSQTTRVIDRTDLGKSQSIGLDDKDPAKCTQRVEFVVTEMKADQKQ